MNRMVYYDNWKGTYTSNEKQKQAQLERYLMIFHALKPVLSEDGDKWCYLYGEYPANCIAGYGDTPYDAMIDFVNEFCTAKTQKKSKPC